MLPNHEGRAGICCFAGGLLEDHHGGHCPSCVHSSHPGIPSLTHLCWALEDRTEKQANCDAEEKSKADADFNVEDNPKESHVGLKEAYFAYLKTKGAS